MSGSTLKRKRSLILAGGGVKVGFQAGVLQVWLDEAGLTFDHGDGCSGGVFNLAMMCQGMSGRQIADNWRKTKPLLGIDFNWQEFIKLFYASSMFTLDAYRKNVFTGWGLDWTKINNSSLDASFNVYNFSRHELRSLRASEMNEDFLCACVSLPMWFPPVVIAGETYIDGVFITDANLEEAIKRGADEIWVIWTVSEKSEWHDGFVAHYFQVIETIANGNLRRICKRIEDSNAAIAAGQAGEFGRRIDLKILRAEVPLHYLINFSSDRLVESVNSGVERAREWCAKEGIPVKPAPGSFPTDVHEAVTKLQFTEEMKGFVTLGETDYDLGYRKGRKDEGGSTALRFRLTIKVDGVNRFVTNPQHEARAEGTIYCDAFGGERQIENGVFNLFVDAVDPARKSMYYRLQFRTDQGKALTLVGHKEIKDDPGLDVWSDTTTLFVRILEGHVAPKDAANAKVVAAGILHIHMLDFLRQLTTFRTEGPTITDRAAAMARFGRLFLGKLWDVYARELLTYGPF